MGGAARRPGRPKGSRTKSPAQRQSELVQAAIATVRRLGPDASMEEIAREAGITRSVLYEYFDGKEGLRVAVVARYGDELVSSLARAVDTDLAPQHLLRAIVSGFVDIVDRDPHLYRFAAAEGQTMLQGAADTVGKFLGHALRQAHADSGGAEIYAYATLGAILTAAEQWVRTRSMTRTDFIDYLWQLLWDGFGSTGLEKLDEPIDLSILAGAIPDAYPAHRDEVAPDDRSSSEEFDP